MCEPRDPSSTPVKKIPGGWEVTRYCAERNCRRPNIRGTGKTLDEAMVTFGRVIKKHRKLHQQGLGFLDSQDSGGNDVRG